MKTLDLNTYGVREMNAVEMRETDGGASPWADLFWMYAEEILNGYVAVCTVAQKWAVANPDYTAGRSFTH
ncbi:MAG: hypothetical protein ACK5KP_09700 [Paludibacteraceae bacterium]